MKSPSPNATACRMVFCVELNWVELVFKILIGQLSSAVWEKENTNLYPSDFTQVQGAEMIQIYNMIILKPYNYLRVHFGDEGGDKVHAAWGKCHVLLLSNNMNDLSHTWWISTRQSEVVGGGFFFGGGGLFRFRRHCSEATLNYSYCCRHLVDYTEMPLFLYSKEFLYFQHLPK